MRRPSLLKYSDARKGKGWYPITAGEVKRRAGPPEYMSATGLKQYLRVGKGNTKVLSAMKDVLPSVKGKAQISPLAKLLGLKLSKLEQEVANNQSLASTI